MTTTTRMVEKDALAGSSDLTGNGFGRVLPASPQAGGEHSVRVRLKPVSMTLPPSPSLLTLEIKTPAISLRGQAQLSIANRP
jgi:hypothetical protein